MSDREPTAPRIDIGIVVAGPLDEVDRRAVERVREEVRGELTRVFPDFEWRLALVRRDEAVSSPRIEPVDLFELGVEERDAQRWDFVLIVTAADLLMHEKPLGFAVISRVLDLAVVSTSRIDPRAIDPDVAEPERGAAIARRLRALLLHALGDLVGLRHAQTPGNPMVSFADLDELDRAGPLDEDQRREASTGLQAIADLRLEEAEPRARRSPLFYPRAAWINRSEIVDEVLKAQPWQFPMRLSRLTAAAVSAMVVLLMTAETWEVASHQPVAALTALILGSMLVTTGYVAVRQRLLLRHGRRWASEQIVTTNVSSVLIVLVGLSTMAVILFGVSLAAAILLFRRTVAASWTALEAPSIIDHVEVAVFVTSLSLLIGALGASFEAYHHFRHVIFVDEEL